MFQKNTKNFGIFKKKISNHPTISTLTSPAPTHREDLIYECENLNISCQMSLKSPSGRRRSWWGTGHGPDLPPRLYPFELGFYSFVCQRLTNWWWWWRAALATKLAVSFRRRQLFRNDLKMGERRGFKVTPIAHFDDPLRGERGWILTFSLRVFRLGEF